MKKIVSAVLIGALTLGVLTGCSAKPETPETPGAETVTIKVAASPTPHAEILKEVVPILAEQGITLEIVEFTDYVQPNIAVYDGELDANFFQHQPYLDDFNKERNMDLTTVGKVHVEPLGVYSKTITDFASIPDGATIGLPNDNTNLARALMLLEANGLIKLKEGVGIAATERDIVENPKNIVVKTMEAATLPRLLEDVDAAVINTNYAIPAGLNPVKDALVIENADSPYANIIATRKDNVDADSIKKLVEALNSETIKTFIETKYEGAIVPAF